MHSFKPFKSCLALILFTAFAFTANSQPVTGHTEICKWQGDKNGAVSITYDDGSINQFRYALPIM
jgi:hypothetical protein